MNLSNPKCYFKCQQIRVKLDKVSIIKTFAGSEDTGVMAGKRVWQVYSNKEGAFLKHLESELDATRTKHHFRSAQQPIFTALVGKE